MINTQAKSTLARLLAKENISVVEGNYKTASFNVVDRVLQLPMWKDKGKDVYDLLVGHEVGHALFTPADGWHNSQTDVEGIPRSYLNIVEDIRIERAIQRQYPGLVGSFKRGYKVLFDENFFGTKDRNMESYALPDRINVKAKLADLAQVPFASEEAPLVRQCFTVETWEDVVAAARALYEYMNQKQEEKNEEPQSTSEGSESEESGDEGSSSESYEQEESTEDSSESQSDGDDTPSEGQNSTDSMGDRSEEEAKEESKVTPSFGAGNPETPIDKIETDDAFREAEKDLVEVDSRGKQPIAIKPLSKDDVKKAVIGYKEVLEDRARVRAERTSSFPERVLMERNEKMNEAYSVFASETDRAVKVMVKEFEMRKAAFRYSRATTSKTGALDTLKVHSYKFNDDIFARSTKLADAKSHGMVMLVDYSGSMQNIIAQVLRQVINLSSFCRKANIPFVVYGFTSGTNGKKFDTNLEMSQLKLFEILTSEMTKAEFTRAVYEIYCQSWEFENSLYYSLPTYLSEIEHLGGTPLNESLLVLHSLVPQFKAKYNLDKVNLTVLTDGEAQNVYSNDPYDPNRLTTEWGAFAVTVNGKRRVVRSRDSQPLIDAFRETGVNTIGYYVCDSSNDFRYRMYRIGVKSEEEIRELRRDYNKQKFTSFDDKLGFDRYFVLRSGKTLDTKNEEFEVMEGAKKGEITRQFKKFAGSKKTNRVLATKFAEVIA